MNKEDEEIIISIINNLQVMGRDYIRKSHLIKALEEAFPEKEKKQDVK